VANQGLDSPGPRHPQCPMDEKIVLKLIEFQSHIGITEEERRRAQPMGVDLELRYPEGAWSAASQSDDIAQAIDYAIVFQRVVEVGTAGKYQLLERLAEEILKMVFAEFAVAEAAIWLRKLVPPVTGIGESVGVRVRRRREDGTGLYRPASFLSDHVHRLRRGHALSVGAPTRPVLPRQRVHAPARLAVTGLRRQAGVHLSRAAPAYSLAP